MAATPPSRPPAEPALRRWARRLLPRALRNWLRNPGASWRWLRSAWSWRQGRTGELECGDGVRLRCHPESARTFRLFVEEPDSRAELDAFRAVLRPGMRLWDLGAHYGFFSLYTLASAGGAQVLAVEPSPAAFRVLLHNLSLAENGPQAQALQAAAGAACGALPMLAAGIAGENYMVMATPGRRDQVAVPQLDFAGLRQACGWSPSHIKIDIEGHESELLAAAGNLAALAEWRPIILLELHNDWIRARGREPGEILDALERLGYAPPQGNSQPRSAHGDPGPSGRPAAVATRSPGYGLNSGYASPLFAIGPGDRSRAPPAAAAAGLGPHSGPGQRHL
jgi:FkbM family methyltransferase